MLSQVIIGILGIVIPIVFVWGINKLDVIIKNNLARQALQVITGELKEVYDSIFSDLKLLAADGEVSKEDQQKLLAKMKEEFSKSKNEVVKVLAPEAYKYILEMMLKDLK